jgi:hypothetical protein
MRKVYAFMLEKVQAEEDLAELLDAPLVNRIPGYSTSVQRAEIAERLAVSTSNEYRRKLWTLKKEEIAKTPAHERKDFRAKGELLDPGR